MTNLDKRGQLEEIDGKWYVWADSETDTKYEVVSFLDAQGEEIDTEEGSVGGVYKVGEMFAVFMQRREDA